MEILQRIKSNDYNSASTGLTRILYEINQSNMEHGDLRKLINYIASKYEPLLELTTSFVAQSEHKTKSGLDKPHVETFYIVTPSYNSVATIEETIKSVVNQKGNFNIIYHVQDGGSKDGTVQLLNFWKDRLEREYCHVTFSYDSCNDNGMYDAIAKGFTTILPDKDVWMTWINADDIIFNGVFDFLQDVALTYPGEVNWITGYQAVNIDNELRPMHNLPLSTSMIANGVCDGKNWWFVQQEGTFWRKKIWDKICKKTQFTNYKYAGDWSLWYSMAQHNVELIIAQMPMGVFHVRQGQLSQAHFGEYMEEIDSIVPKSNREKYIEEMWDKDFKVSYIQRLNNYNALMMYSVLFKITGKKSTYPSPRSIKLIK